MSVRLRTKSSQHKPRYMRGIVACGCALILATSALAQSTKESRKNVIRGADGAAGMVVTGDQEAPLVLYIVPWQEPAAKRQLPAAPAIQLVPQVLDYERSLAEEPLSKALPGGATAAGKR